MAFVAGAVWYVVVHPWTSALLIAGVAALLGLLLLRARFPWVRRWVDRVGDIALRGYLRGTYWGLAAFGPVAAARSLAELVADVPLLVALALLLVWAGVLLLLVRPVWSEARRRALWLRLRGVDRVTPFLYAFVVASVAVILFATLAFILSDREVIRFGTDPAAAETIAEPADALDFFVWHLLDSIPSFHVTETLRWKEPLGYTDSGVGVLLLAFKIVVLAPIVAAFAGFWRYSQESAGAKRV
jgi:hypothetical protein